MAKSQQNVALLMGGWSAEREVSLSSGGEIAKALEKMGHAVRVIDVTDDSEALLQHLTPRPDVIFNALHGTGGEDGVIQGFLDVLKIPYTHSGVAASAIAMDKVLSRKIFEHHGIPTPPWALVKRMSLKDHLPFEKPFVIKPLKNGSSRGVYIVKDTLPEEIFSDAWAFGDDLLIEKYLPGREIQVGVLGEKALGAIEICPKTEFYDYQAKYTEGFAEHIMPAGLSKDDYDHVLELGLRAHNALGCRGVSRVDFIFYEGTFYLLEVNTHPGMTPLSLVPEIAAYKGLSFEDVLQHLLNHATYRT